MRKWISTMICLAVKFNISYCQVHTHDTLTRSVIEIKRPDLFLYSGFIIIDTTNSDNRFVRGINAGKIEYYEPFLLTENDVLKLENYLKTPVTLNQVVTNIHSKKIVLNSILNNYYRQYMAYKLNNDIVVINIYFCSKDFYIHHSYFANAFLSPLIVNSSKKGSLFSVIVKSTISFDNLSITSVHKW